MLPVSLDYPFLMAPSVFSNVYLCTYYRVLPIGCHIYEKSPEILHLNILKCKIYASHKKKVDIKLNVHCMFL